MSKLINENILFVEVNHPSEAKAAMTEAKKQAAGRQIKIRLSSAALAQLHTTMAPVCVSGLRFE